MIAQQSRLREGNKIQNLFGCAQTAKLPPADCCLESDVVRVLALACMPS